MGTEPMGGRPGAAGGRQPIAEASPGAGASAAADDHAALVGQVLGGKWRILSLIGVGGMGAVYHGQHSIIERDAAVKVLLPACHKIPGVRERFFREARVANRVQHDNVVDVTDLGETDDGRLYLVMEYLRGETLYERLERGEMPLANLLEMTLEVCAGLGAAHDLGIVHRDVTPSNIFLLQRGPGSASGPMVKVLDFGIAFIKAESRLTQPGQLIGNPDYIAPETVLGQDVTPASDLYSLGAVLYHALAGRPPFQGPNYAAVGLKHVTEAPKPLLELRPRLSPRLVALVMRCLEKQPPDRPAGAHEVAEEIRQVLREFGAKRDQSVPPASTVSGAIAGALGSAVTECAPGLQVSTSVVTAWKEYVQRARSWMEGHPDDRTTAQVRQLETTIEDLELSEAEIMTWSEAAAEAQEKLDAAQERFDRALATLQDEEARVGERQVGAREAFEAARKRGEEVRRELAAARGQVATAERNLRSAVGTPAARGDEPEHPDQAVVEAYQAAGEAAARYEEAAAEERSARRLLREADEELRDIRFQIEQLSDNRTHMIEPLAAEFDGGRRELALREARRGELYRKLIGLAAALAASP